MQIILIDERVWNFDEQNRTCQPAIVPPIGLQRGNAVFVARVIDGGHDKVAAGMNSGGHLAVEAGVTALMLANLLAVDPEPGVVVGRAYVEEDARMLFGLISKIVLVPNRPLIEEERLALRIPVGGHLQRGSLR